MSEAIDLDEIEIEIVARMLHARKCRSSGIHDDNRIALYWEGCDQDMYRMEALRRGLPTPQGEEQ
jgi:hypothetical protein